jgi:hypothetical protein
MSTDRQTRSFVEIQPPGPGGDDLPLLRFGLRQLLCFVAVLSLLLGVVVSSHGVTAIALLLAATVVLLHLFSTALGTQLRWHANRTLARNGPANETDVCGKRIAYGGRRVTIPRAHSPWYDRGSTPLPWVPKLVAAMALLGGSVGAILLAATTGDRTSLTGILVGATSFAVVAGWGAFLCGSFYGILRHGFRDAVAEHKNDRSARDPASRGM